MTTKTVRGDALVAQAAELAALDRDSVIYWLRWASPLTTVQARRDMAHKIMTVSVFTQAYILGLVFCSMCGDQGCEACPS